MLSTNLVVMKKLVKAFQEIPFTVKFLIFIALILRIFLMSFPGFRIDINGWEGWAVRLTQVGPFNFYSSDFFADYLPFFYIFFWVVSEFFSFFFGASAIYSDMFVLYFKLINNLFDLGTSFTIFLIVRKYNKNLSFLAPIFYLLNPGTLFDVSVWGQTDSIPTFLFLSSIYFLNEKSKLLKSGILTVMAFLIKPLNIAVMPFMFIRLILSFPVKKIIATFLFSFLFGFLTILPFFPDNPISGIVKQFLNSTNTYPYTSINAFNFWGIIGFWKPDSMLFLGIPYKLIGIVITGLLFLVIILVFLKLRGKDIKIDYLSYTLSSFIFFMFLTRMHERHIFPVFALLLISALVYKSKLLITSYVFLSFIFFLNLFYAYYYYNFIFINKHSGFDFLFFFVSDFTALFSLLNLLIFILLITYYILILKKWRKN